MADHDTASASEDKPKRPLKKLLAKQKRGELEDLTTEEVNELTAYARFSTQVEIETEMSQRIAAEMEAVNAKFAALKAEYEDRLAELERNYIIEDYKAELNRINAEYEASNEQG